MPLDQAPIALGLLRPTVSNITEDNQKDYGDGADVDLGAVQNQMLGIFHGRLAELGKSSRYIESLPDEAKLIIEGSGVSRSSTMSCRISISASVSCSRRR